MRQIGGSVVERARTHGEWSIGKAVAGDVGNRCLRGLRPIGIDLFAANDLCLCFFSVRPSNE